jgi:hypothetical protein
MALEVVVVGVGSVRVNVDRGGEQLWSPRHPSKSVNGVREREQLRKRVVAETLVHVDTEPAVEVV